jgi:hypothetical protein
MKKLLLALLLFIGPATLNCSGELVSPGSIMEYKTICSCTPSDLDAQINNYLREPGWRLWGLPYVTHNFGNFRCACQALVKFSGF